MKINREKPYIFNLDYDDLTNMFPRINTKNKNLFVYPFFHGISFNKISNNDYSQIYTKYLMSYSNYTNNILYNLLTSYIKIANERKNIIGDSTKTDKVKKYDDILNGKLTALITDEPYINQSPLLNGKSPSVPPMDVIKFLYVMFMSSEEPLVFTVFDNTSYTGNGLKLDKVTINGKSACVLNGNNSIKTDIYVIEIVPSHLVFGTGAVKFDNYEKSEVNYAYNIKYEITYDVSNHTNYDEVPLFLTRIRKISDVSFSYSVNNASYTVEKVNNNYNITFKSATNEFKYDTNINGKNVDIIFDNISKYDTTGLKYNTYLTITRNLIDKKFSLIDSTFVNNIIKSFFSLLEKNNKSVLYLDGFAVLYGIFSLYETQSYKQVTTVTERLLYIFNIKSKNSNTGAYYTFRVFLPNFPFNRNDQTVDDDNKIVPYNEMNLTSTDLIDSDYDICGLLLNNTSNKFISNNYIISLFCVENTNPSSFKDVYYIAKNNFLYTDSSVSFQQIAYYKDIISFRKVLPYLFNLSFNKSLFNLSYDSKTNKIIYKFNICGMPFVDYTNKYATFGELNSFVPITWIKYGRYDIITSEYINIFGFINDLSYIMNTDIIVKSVNINDDIMQKVELQYNGSVVNIVDFFKSYYPNMANDVIGNILMTYGDNCMIATSVCKLMDTVDKEKVAIKTDIDYFIDNKNNINVLIPYNFNEGGYDNKGKKFYYNYLIINLGNSFTDSQRFLDSYIDLKKSTKNKLIIKIISNSIYENNINIMTIVNDIKENRYIVNVMLYNCNRDFVKWLNDNLKNNTNKYKEITKLFKIFVDIIALKTL